jgi:uncharacterized protein CbrC (UPF0167 family)
MNPLPQFRYFPDPLGVGAIGPTSASCECCGQARGYTYTRQIYTTDEIETICPWCIADGTAAEKFDGVFVDDHPLLQAGLDMSIVDEVSKRTPGYESWQEPTWRACCNDACEFHGDENRDYLLSLDQSELLHLSQQTRFPFDVLVDVIQHYQPRSSPAIYRFRCRHCGAIHHHADFH